MTSYLLHWRPYETPLLNNLEIFNEVLTDMIIINMYLLTDAYPFEIKNFGGYGFLTIIGLICTI